MIHLRSSSPRQGLTLLEVLITIFVMAIGFLSVLTLFPLAARKIIRSIDSDRASLISGNSGLALNILGFKKDAQAIFESDLMNINANPGLATLKFKRSRYVHTDPIAINAGYSPPLSLFPQFFPTTVVSFPGGFNSYRDLLISQDEIQFTAEGKPEPGFRRGQRYSTSFLFSRGKLNDPNSINCLTLVYVGRPVESGVDNQIPLNIQPRSGPDKSLEFILNGQLPNNGPDREFGRNSWILDITPTFSLVGYQIPQFKKFYQVQNVEPISATQFKVVLDRPISCESGATFLEQAIWFDYLFDVFDRGTGE